MRESPRKTRSACAFMYRSSPTIMPVTKLHTVQAIPPAIAPRHTRPVLIVSVIETSFAVTTASRRPVPARALRPIQGLVRFADHRLRGIRPRRRGGRHSDADRHLEPPLLRAEQVRAHLAAHALRRP